jgi:hypothetical protein
MLDIVISCINLFSGTLVYSSDATGCPNRVRVYTKLYNTSNAVRNDIMCVDVLFQEKKACVSLNLHLSAAGSFCPVCTILFFFQINGRPKSTI